MCEETMEQEQLVQLKGKATAAIDAHADDLHSISRYLYENPEICWQERLAAERLSDYLEAKGFAVERNIGGFETAFRATLDSGRPGPTVAFLAEYDALPGVGHGCGHNLIAAAAVGAALGVQAALPELAGKVVVLGTPAEEFTDQLEGKVRLLQAGQFDGIDACLMTHPYRRFAAYNTSLAFIAVEVVFHGQTAHAAADPWNGRNALDGVILLFNHLSALRQHVRPEIRIHGIVTDGGIVPNIIPERAATQFMLRAPQRSQVDELYERFKACAEGAALATGTTVEVKTIGAVSDVRPYPTLQAVTDANFRALGVPFGPPANSSGSTDFGDVSYAMPTDSFYFDLGAGDIPWHSRDVADASVREPALASMRVAAKVLAMDAVDLLAEPGIIRQAQQEMPD